jgi:hypothetical protein
MLTSFHFRIEARRLQLVDPAEQLVGEARDRDRFSQSLPVYADMRTILQFALASRRSLIHYLPIQPKGLHTKAEAQGSLPVLVMY